MGWKFSCCTVADIPTSEQRFIPPATRTDIPSLYIAHATNATRLGLLSNSGLPWCHVRLPSCAPYYHPLHGYAFCWLCMYSTIPLPFHGWPAVMARPGPHSQTVLTSDWNESEDNTSAVVRSPEDSCLLSEPNSPWDMCHVPSNHNWWLESTVYWEDIVVAGVER